MRNSAINEADARLITGLLTAEAETYFGRDLRLND